MINEKYFLDRLAAGESIDDIGKEIADMMNAAVAKHNEEEQRKAALKEQEAAKRELMAELCDIMKELMILEGIDEKLINFSEKDVNTLLKTFSTALSTIKNISAVSVRTDDEILRDFFNMFN